MPEALVALAALAVGLAYAIAGNGYVLDDWFILRDAQFGGAWEAGENWRRVRPGAAVVYSAVYGPGRAPGYVIAVLTVINVVAALLLLRLLQRFVPRTVALAVSLLWVALPMRTSIEVWAAASNIAVAVALGLAALLLLTDQKSRLGFLVGGGWLCLVSGLTYESPAAALALAAMVLPLLRRVDRPLAAAAAGVSGCVAALAWSLSNPDPVKSRVLRLEDLTELARSVGGWGVVPRGWPADLLLVVFLGLVLLVAARLLLGDLRKRTGLAEYLVVAGIVVAGAGVAPFLLYGYVPFGFGDRANAVISIGAALIWCGFLLLFWQWRRPVAVVAGVVLVLGMGVARVQRVDNWTTAGQDAARIVADLPVAMPAPPPVIVAGPKPIIRENVAAFLDSSNIEAAAQVAYEHRDVSARMAFSEQAFRSADARIRYDLRIKSLLEPDMEVYPPGPQDDLAELPAP